MRLKRRLVRGMLWFYPEHWRAEYGPELEALLLRRPLTLATAANVVSRAWMECLRGGEIWKPCASVGLVCSLAVTIWNSLWPLSPEQYGAYWRCELLAELAIGFWAAFHGNAGIRQAANQAANVSLAGGLPELTIGFLGLCGILHPVLYAPSRRPSRTVFGSAAILVIRSGVPARMLEVFSGVLLSAGAGGIIVGGAGATLGRLLRHVRPTWAGGPR